MGKPMTVVAPSGSGPTAAPPAEVPGLSLHKFVKKDSWRGAVTGDATGGNLPHTGSAWIYAKPVLVSPGDRRVGPSSLQIAQGISDRGYFLFPISDDV